MNGEILKMVSNILKVDEEFLKNHCKILTEIDAVYYWNPIRGGLSIIVNNDGEKLVATSAIKFDQHYNDFCDGKRN